MPAGYLFVLGIFAAAEWMPLIAAPIAICASNFAFSTASSLDAAVFNMPAIHASVEDSSPLSCPSPTMLPQQPPPVNGRLGGNRTHVSGLRRAGTVYLSRR